MVCCHWQIPAPSAAYVILRLDDLSNCGLSEAINEIQKEMLKGRLKENGLRYLRDNSEDYLVGLPQQNGLKNTLNILTIGEVSVYGRPSLSPSFARNESKSF